VCVELLGIGMCLCVGRAVRDWCVCVELFGIGVVCITSSADAEGAVEFLTVQFCQIGFLARLNEKFTTSSVYFSLLSQISA